jgi:hypothetical protein
MPSPMGSGLFGYDAGGVGTLPARGRRASLLAGVAWHCKQLRAKADATL